MGEVIGSPNPFRIEAGQVYDQVLLLRIWSGSGWYLIELEKANPYSDN